MHAKNGEKGCLILREVLRKTDTVGISKILIRSKQYLSAVFPYKNWLLGNLLRFLQEFRKLEDLNLSSQNIKQYKIQNQK